MPRPRSWVCVPASLPSGEPTALEHLLGDIKPQTHRQGGVTVAKTHSQRRPSSPAKTPGTRTVGVEAPSRPHAGVSTHPVPTGCLAERRRSINVWENKQGRENVTRCPERGTPRVPPTRCFSLATSTLRVPGLRGFSRIPRTHEGDMTSGLHAEQPRTPKSPDESKEEGSTQFGLPEKSFSFRSGAASHIHPGGALKNPSGLATVPNQLHQNPRGRGSLMSAFAKSPCDSLSSGREGEVGAGVGSPPHINYPAPSVSRLMKIG